MTLYDKNEASDPTLGAVCEVRGIVTLFFKLAFLRRIDRAFKFNEVSVRVCNGHNPKTVPNKRACPCLYAA
jgi:hypothetical protein